MPRGINVLSKYEKSALISDRAEDISRGSPITIKNPNTTNPIEIAKLELKAKTIPYKVIRTFPDGSTEIWKVKDLIIN